MGSTPATDGTPPPHVVLVPFPAHGHVAPHVQLGCALRARGVHVTLVHTKLHHRRLLLARAGNAAKDDGGAGGLAVEVIPDGLSPDDPPQTLRALHEALERNCPAPFAALLRALLRRSPPASCVVADTTMPFASAAARAAGVPDVQFFTASASGLMGYLQFPELLSSGVIPLLNPVGSGSLDTPLEWVPGMKGMRLRDMPTFCHVSDDGDCWLLHFHVHQMRVAAGAGAVVLNTFHDMEKDVVDALKPLLPPVYTVGPLASVLASLPSSPSSPAASGGGGMVSLLKEDGECAAWLEGRAARSVVYVSFGSHASMGGARLREIAAGMARCGSPYLWVLRPEMAAEVAGVRGEDELVVPWCAQEAVLRHPAVGLFVTHCGWNSILESVAAGVPVLGCPVVSEQTTNCRQACTAWGIGGGELPEGGRAGEEIAAMVREMMRGRKGEETREKTLQWKRVAEDSAREGGSSCENIGRFVEDVLLKASHDACHAT